MAHLTKYYPVNKAWDLCTLQFPGYMPPRKFKFINIAQSSGTLAAAWRSITVISDEGVLTLPQNFVDWKLNHPSVPNDFFMLRWTLVEYPSGAPNPPRWIPTLRIQYWHAGLKYGEGTSQLGNNPTFLGGPPQCSQGFQFTTLLDPPKFASLNFARWCAAQWADDPGYHPYRV